MSATTKANRITVSLLPHSSFIFFRKRIALSFISHVPVLLRHATTGVFSFVRYTFIRFIFSRSQPPFLKRCFFGSKRNRAKDLRIPRFLALRNAELKNGRKSGREPPPALRQNQLFTRAISRIYPSSSFGVSRMNGKPCNLGCRAIRFIASIPRNPCPSFSCRSLREPLSFLLSLK